MIKEGVVSIEEYQGMPEYLPDARLERAILQYGIKDIRIILCPVIDLTACKWAYIIIWLTDRFSADRKIKQMKVGCTKIQYDKRWNANRYNRNKLWIN